MEIYPPPPPIEGKHLSIELASLHLQPLSHQLSAFLLFIQVFVTAFMHSFIFTEYAFSYDGVSCNSTNFILLHHEPILGFILSPSWNFAAKRLSWRQISPHPLSGERGWNSRGIDYRGGMRRRGGGDEISGISPTY